MTADDGKEGRVPGRDPRNPGRWSTCVAACPPLGPIFAALDADPAIRHRDRSALKGAINRHRRAIAEAFRVGLATAREATADAAEVLARLEACEPGEAREFLLREASRGFALETAAVAQAIDLVPRTGDLRALPPVAAMGTAHGRNALALAETGRFVAPAGGGGGGDDVEAYAAERAGEAVQAFADAAVAVGALDPGRIGEVLAALSGRALPAHTHGGDDG